MGDRTQHRRRWRDKRFSFKAAPPPKHPLERFVHRTVQGLIAQLWRQGKW